MLTILIKSALTTLVILFFTFLAIKLLSPGRKADDNEEQIITCIKGGQGCDDG